MVVNNTPPVPAPARLPQNSILSDEILKLIDEEVQKLLFRSRAQNHEDFRNDAIVAVLEATRHGRLPVPSVVKDIVRSAVHQSRYQYDKFWDKVEAAEIPEDGTDPEWDEGQRHRVASRVDDFWRVRRSEREALLALHVSPVKASRRAQGHAVRRLAQDLPPVFRALTFLTTVQRNTIYWYFWHQHTEQQIADRLGVHRSTISRALHFAKKQLARELTRRKGVPVSFLKRGEQN